MSNLPNFTQNNEQILDDIQKLLTIEKQLSNTLETNKNLTTSQKKDILSQMNKIYNMCINLYSTLSNVNNFYGDALNTSVSTLKEQTASIAIIENELNLANQRLQVLQDETNNKVRLVEINDYYGDRYSEHAQLMKIIIFVLVPIIILSILYNKGFLPSWAYYILLCIITIIGAVYFWKRLASIISRDNMNYNEYNWKFDPNSGPLPSTSSSTSDPWTSNMSGYGTCIGEDCCISTDMWNSTLGQCVSVGATGTDGFTTNGMPTETFVTDILSKTNFAPYNS